MKPDKKHIRRCFLFCFHQKKNTIDTHRIICKMYDENIIAIRTCANWFKRFKNGDFDISDETVEENELRKDETKIVENDGKYFD